MTVALRMSGKLLRVSGACDTYSKFATARKMTNTLYGLAFSGPATVMPNPTKPMSPFSRHYTFQKTKNQGGTKTHCPIVPPLTDARPALPSLLKTGWAADV